jgi:hypothetical protein
MLLNSETANQMQAALDEVFSRLPKVFRTDEIRNELAKTIVRSRGDYHEVARSTVISMFASIDRAIENRKKLASFK